MLEQNELRVVAHRLRNLLQRVANRAECLEMTDDRSERSTHIEILMRHVEEAAEVIARLDQMAERPER
jgi:light-regulated signal transduction histidine kinase (bacteriophytochrome)